MSLVLTGIVNYTTLNNAAPGGGRAQGAGLRRLRAGSSAAGALMGMISSLLVYQYGQARIWFAMSRDGLLPTHVQQRPSALPRRRTSAPGSRAS